MYDLIVKGGTLIDPAQSINEKMDVAIESGIVQEISRNISDDRSKKTIDASGMFVTPGLVDIHTHSAFKIAGLCIDPEKACLPKGTTTVVDAGSTGELLFSPFRKYVIDKPSKTRIFAFLNVESLGMIEFENDQEWPKLLTDENERYFPLFVNVDRTISTINENRDVIIGIKWAHHGINGLHLARKVCDDAGCILMMESHFMPDGLTYARQGDIITHAYHRNKSQFTQTFDGMMDEDGKIRKEFFDAVKRGVLLDTGHGRGSFSWKTAELALKDNLPPNTISTDLWTGNVEGPVHDLPTTISKFLHLGMSLENAIEASTSAPASAIKRLGEIGTLKPGSCADLSIFKLLDGKFPLSDCYEEARICEKLLTPIYVIRNGEAILPDQKFAGKL